MHHSTHIYIELYKRKLFDKIPVYEDETGTYGLSPKQILAMQLLTNKTTKNVGYGGSARSGKSIVLCFWQLMNRLSYPGTRGLIGRKELKNLGLTTKKTLFTMMNFYGLVDKIDYNYNQQNQVITFNNKSEILMMDTAFAPSDPLFTKFGGLELTDASIDESNETSLEAINIIYSRTGWCMNEQYELPRKTLETFNPEKNHVHRRFWTPYKKNEETEEVRFIKALPTDNPHPAVKGWIDDIVKKGDKIMIARLVDGNFDYDSEDNALCNFDKINDLFTNKFVQAEQQKKDEKGNLVKEHKKFMSCDIAISNDAFVIVNWYGMIIEDIQCIRNISPTQIETQSNGVVNNKIDYKPLVDLLLKQSEKYKVPRSNIVYDADGIGHQIRNFFPNAVALHNNSAPLHQDYKNLKCELEYLLAQKINNAEIYIQANLSSELKERFITEMQMIKRSTEPGEKLATIPKAEIKKLLGHSPDLMDAVKYRLLFCITRRQ
jgi:phage terminase large subunit